MKTEVKAKSSRRSEAAHWNSADHNTTKSRGKCPKCGKRYSRAQKDEKLQYAKETSVADAAAKFDIAETTVEALADLPAWAEFQNKISRGLMSHT